MHQVLEDHFYISPEVTRAAVGPAGRRAFPRPGEVAGLTPREMEVFHLVAGGLGNREIAERLSMSVTTVRTHLNSVYGKLRVKTRVELALYAAQSGNAVS